MSGRTCAQIMRCRPKITTKEVVEKDIVNLKTKVRRFGLQ